MESSIPKRNRWEIEQRAQVYLFIIEKREKEKEGAG